MTKAENAGGNTDMTVNIKDRDSYVFEDAKNSMLKWLSEKQINALPEQHKASYSNPELYQSSLYCATCHNEFTTGQGRTSMITLVSGWPRRLMHRMTRSSINLY